jgi:hypothetical protein
LHERLTELDELDRYLDEAEAVTGLLAGGIAPNGRGYAD